MLYHLFTTLIDRFRPFRVFLYPSFRIPAAALSALGLTLWLLPWCIRHLRVRQGGTTRVREDTPARHQTKHGTPTMGGLLVVAVVLLCSLAWCDLRNVYVWAVLVTMVGFGAIGLADDWLKLSQKNSRGLPGRHKLAWQTLVMSGVLALLAAAHTGVLPTAAVPLDTRLSLPFVAIKWFHPDLGLLYVPFALLVVLGTSHAVNLTDGLDGLAIGPTIVSATTFLVLSYAAGLVLTVGGHGTWVDFHVAEYLNIPALEGGGELAVICAGIAGAGTGFLWYNTFPATVFMGDVGSLALGGVLGLLAVLTKNEFLSCIVHGVFLLEALSVMLQVASFRLLGRRVLRMAPIHHHFELLGWAEPKIIVRFWISSIILALFGLVSLKLR